jgi:transposase
VSATVPLTQTFGHIRGRRRSPSRRRAAGARSPSAPPYSRGLDPIERAFAKLKHLARKAAERTVEATWRRIGSLLDAFTPHECTNYFRSSGYASI